MILLACIMLFLLVIGTPVAFAIAISSTVFFLLCNDGMSSIMIAQRIVNGSNSYILLAVPFFIFTGELMNASGITNRLVKFAESLTGSLRGGLSYVVVIVNMVMAGVSGAAIADAAAVGSVMIPSMQNKGYSKGFATAVNAAAATVGPVIPPSVGFIIYASLANVSVVRLFLAGAVPGVIMGIYMMVVCYIITRRKNLTAGEKTSLIKVSIAFKQAFWALLMPIIILGGIIASIVTPTEAGVLAVIYGLVVGIFIYRTIKLQDIPYLLAKSAKQTAVLMFIITVAQAFGWILSRQGAPEILMNLFSDISPHRWVFLLILNFVIIFLGCFMEGGSIMIILTPLLLPTLKKYGVDLVHFGVVFQLNIMIGLLTPPVGMLLFVISSISGVQVNKMFGNLWPFFIAILIVLFLVTFFPHITLFLPNILA